MALLGSVRVAIIALVLVRSTRDPGAQGGLLPYPLLGGSDPSILFFTW